MRILNIAETRDALRELALDAPTGTGFAFSNRARNTFYDWHTHDYHQLIYAITGATQLETDDAKIPAAAPARGMDSRRRPPSHAGLGYQRRLALL